MAAGTLTVKNCQCIMQFINCNTMNNSFKRLLMRKHYAIQWLEKTHDEEILQIMIVDRVSWLPKCDPNTTH